MKYQHTWSNSGSLLQELSLLERLTSNESFPVLPDSFKAYLSNKKLSQRGGESKEAEAIKLHPTRIFGQDILGFPYWIVYSTQRDCLYVSDIENQMITCFSKEGEFISTSGQGLTSPLGFLEEADGGLLICERQKKRISRLSLDGHLSEWLVFDGTNFPGDGIDEPIQIHIYEGNYTFLLSDKTDRFRKVVVAKNGSIGPIDTGDHHINGLWVDSDILLAASIFKGDILTYNNRMHRFLRVNRWELPSQVYSCCRLDGIHYVLCNNSRSLIMLDRDGRYVGGEMNLKGAHFRDVHLHAITSAWIDGKPFLFISDDYNHCVHKIAL